MELSIIEKFKLSVNILKVLLYRDLMNNEIYIMNVDGSDVKELLSEKDKVFFSPKLSPSANHRQH